MAQAAVQEAEQVDLVPEVAQVQDLQVAVQEVEPVVLALLQVRQQHHLLREHLQLVLPRQREVYLNLQII